MFSIPSPNIAQSDFALENLWFSVAFVAQLIILKLICLILKRRNKSSSFAVIFDYLSCSIVQVVVGVICYYLFTSMKNLDVLNAILHIMGYLFAFYLFLPFVVVMTAFFNFICVRCTAAKTTTKNRLLFASFGMITWLTACGVGLFISYFYFYFLIGIFMILIFSFICFERMTVSRTSIIDRLLFGSLGVLAWLTTCSVCFFISYLA